MDPGNNKFEKMKVKDFESEGFLLQQLKTMKSFKDKGYGIKDIEKENDSISNGTIYNIASCSKAHTSACLAKLAGEGSEMENDRRT